jgi:hypothetical protein
MDELHVFVSVGGTANEKQEAFVRAIEQRLQSEGLIPHTVGRNTFDSDSPLKTVMNSMDTCSGVVVIALERMYFPTGVEKRGGKCETSLGETKIPTCWNQVEAAMAYCKGLPLLVMVERGIRSEGLLERGYDWYLQWIDPDPSALLTAEFNGVLAGWKQKVSKNKSVQSGKKDTEKVIDPDWTFLDFIKRMKPAQLWGVLVALAGLIAGAFTLGTKLVGPVK